jgi:hypothetical protein
MNRNRDVAHYRHNVTILHRGTSSEPRINVKPPYPPQGQPHRIRAYLFRIAAMVEEASIGTLWSVKVDFEALRISLELNSGILDEVLHAHNVLIEVVNRRKMGDW